MEFSDTAKKLVDDLFVNGFGQEADRLVLTTAEGKDLGGWCKKAVLDRVEEALRSELLERRKEDRQLAAVMYQFAGANMAPLRFMDVLAKAQRGESYSVDGLLPYSADENGKEWTNVAPFVPAPPEVSNG